MGVWAPRWTPGAAIDGGGTAAGESHKVVSSGDRRDGRLGHPDTRRAAGAPWVARRSAGVRGEGVGGMGPEQVTGIRHGRQVSRVCRRGSGPVKIAGDEGLG
jgi:hypothetical protein